MNDQEIKLKRNRPMIIILEHIIDGLKQYNEYRKNKGLMPFAIITNSLYYMQPNKDVPILLNVYVGEVEMVSSSLWEAQETITINIDMLLTTTSIEQDAYRQLLDLQHDIRRMLSLVGAENDNFGLGVKASNRGHPSFQPYTAMSENLDVDAAFGQIRQKIDVVFTYKQEHNFIEGVEINFELLLGGEDEDR